MDPVKVGPGSEQDGSVCHVQPPQQDVVSRRRELRPDSAGAGEFRGGYGQSVEIGHVANAPFLVSAMFDRVEHAARGRKGGKDGAPGRVSLASGATLKPKGVQAVPAGDRLRLDLPGGAGLGDPRKRDRARVAEELRRGLMTPDAARETYGPTDDALEEQRGGKRD